MEEKVNGNVIREKVVVENKPPVVEVVKPVEKKHEGFPKVVAIVLFVIILAMAGFMVWHFMTANHEAKECETPKDEEPSQPVVVSPSEEWENDVRVREVVAALRAKAESDLTRDTGSGGVVTMSIENLYDQQTLTVKPRDVNVAINLDRTYGFVVSEVTDKVLYDFVMSGKLAVDLSEVLVQRGFAKSEEVMGVNVYSNSNTGILCTVGSGLPFNVVCGHESWYDKDKVGFLNELAEAYKEKTGEYPYYLNADEKNIENSEYGSYQRLGASEFGAGALFYRTSPDAKWQFFTSTQALLSCSKYDTDDLKKAYLGEPCYDEAKGADGKVEL